VHSLSRDPAKGGPDRRRTEEEFAKDVGESFATIHNRFAATGTLSCLASKPCEGHPEKQCPFTMEASAQLVGPDVITTAAHTLEDEKTCQPLSKAESCTFTIKGVGAPQMIKVSGLVEQGFKCPTTFRADLDWAVMKLSRAAREVSPYRIDHNLVEEVRSGDRVLTVCRSMDFVRRDRNGQPSNPKHINSCAVRKVYKMYGEPIYFSTDCNSSIYCSGGSLLNGNNDDPALLGMLVNDGEPLADAEKAFYSHTVNKHPFDEQTWAARYIPFAGDFLEAIKRATASSAMSKDN
jgi:hypothetical protein